jgi:hypothetical protein
MAIDGNVLDSFFVALGFKVDKEGIEKFQTSLEKMRGFALQLGAALSVPALGLFVEEVAKSVGHLEHFAKVNHLSFEELQAFNAIARENSIDVESMDQGIANFNKRLGQAQIGTGRLLPILKTLGIGLRDAHGHTKSVNQVLGDLADKMHKFALAGEGEKNLGLGQRLGLDPGMVLLLEKGSKAWADLYGQAKKGAALTEQQGELAEKTDILFTQARHSIAILWDLIALRLMPTVDDMLEKFNAWVKTISSDKTNTFNKALMAMAQVAESIWQDFHEITDALGPFVRWILDVTPVWAMKDALYGVAGALLAVGLGLVLSTGAGAIARVVSMGAAMVSFCRTAITWLGALGAAELLTLWPLLLIGAALGALSFTGFELYKHRNDISGNDPGVISRHLSATNTAYKGYSSGWNPMDAMGAHSSNSQRTTIIHHTTNVPSMTVVSPDPLKAGDMVREALKPNNLQSLIRNAQSGVVY